MPHTRRTLDANNPPQAAREVAAIIPNTARALLGLAEDRRLSTERLCKGLGFTWQDLMDQEVLLSYRQMCELIHRAQRLIAEPALGLAVGGRQTPVSWGLVGLAMLTCETFGEAVAYGLSYQSEAGSMVEHLMEEQGQELYIEVVPRQFDLQLETFLVDEAFSGALSVARYLLGPGFKPLRIDLAMPRPDREDVYRHFFGCPVRFGTGCNRMTLASHWLSARLPGYDRITCGLIRKQLNTILTRPIGQHDLVETIANRMRFDIGSQPSQQTLAGMVNMSERTLRRRLGAQDITYRELRDSTRYDKARDLLIHSTISIAEVAEAVGYSDARAFRRAFKRWSGMLPGDYRRRSGELSG